MNGDPHSRKNRFKIRFPGQEKEPVKIDFSADGICENNWGQGDGDAKPASKWLYLRHNKAGQPAPGPCLPKNGFWRN